MRSNLLLLVLALAFGFSSCDKGSDDPVDDGTTTTDDGNNNTFPFPTNMEDIAKAIAGDNVDQSVKIWKGNKLYRAYYNPATGEYEDEGDATDDPDILFKEMTLEVKYDKYNADKFGNALGNLKWVDPDGKTGMNWEIKNESPDIIRVNEGAPTAQVWTILTLNDTKFEFTREWKSGNQRFKERLIWVK